MLSPSCLRLKNNWGTCQKGGGKFGNSVSYVSSSLLNMTLSTSCQVGTSSFLSLTFLGWAIYFCLPFDLCHVIMTTDPMDPKAAKLLVMVVYMFKSCPSAVTLTSDSLYHPKSFCILSSHVDDVGFIMTLLRHGRFLSTSTHYPGS